MPNMVRNWWSVRFERNKGFHSLDQRERYINIHDAVHSFYRAFIECLFQIEFHQKCSNSDESVCLQSNILKENKIQMKP